jgi:hypothetical protein
MIPLLFLIGGMVVGGLLVAGVLWVRIFVGAFRRAFRKRFDEGYSDARTALAATKLAEADADAELAQAVEDAGYTPVPINLGSDTLGDITARLDIVLAQMRESLDKTLKPGESAQELMYGVKPDDATKGWRPSEIEVRLADIAMSQQSAIVMDKESGKACGVRCQIRIS